MSDFFLDFRQGSRAAVAAAKRLRFAADTQAVVIDEPGFSLACTYTGNPELWSPHRDRDGSLAVIAGRPAFDEDEWESGCTVPGCGGLAGKLVFSRYREFGARALERLNGSCAAIVYDAQRQILHLSTDRCGVFPVFETEDQGAPLYGSHPDVLADAANQSHRIDETSLAEFILSGTVSAPFSYYERVHAADSGTVLTFEMGGGRPRMSRRRYFEFIYRGDERVQEEDLAEELGAALRRAVQRRTLPRLGPVAVALSGGLDSRVVLASCSDRSRTFAFTCYDQPNRELRTAAAIAGAQPVRFLPVQRGPEYYAENAEMGVRISGGMGSFANNHFLGVIPRLKSEGMENLLTGCYFDYLFKGLPLTRSCHWLTLRERLAPYRDQFYFDHFPASTPLAERMRERWASRIPDVLKKQDSPEAVFQLETRRTFPLSYEGDNQQRVVPQRVTGWSPPAVDRDVVDVYCKLPYSVKLNRSIFRKVVNALGPEVRRIPDANTGAAPDSSRMCEWIRATQMRALRKWRRLRNAGSSDESWLDWPHYLNHSHRLDALWKRPNPDAMELFRRVLGPSHTRDDFEATRQIQPLLFIGLLTVKLWMEERA